LENLRTIDRALADPHRLIELACLAEDEDEAINALCREFQLTEETAAVVMHQQIRGFTRASIADRRQRMAALEQGAPEGRTEPDDASG
jgi:hypothetical protein